MPQLWVVAGPNGVGKSTLTRRYLAGRLPIVDPDVLVQDLGLAAPPLSRRRIQAGREALHRQETLLTQGADFAVETTLSGKRELVLVQRARESGYKVTLVYLGVDSPDIALGRITQRVTAGGHEVPAAEADRRYTRSMNNLATVLRHVDRAFVLDNTGQRFRLLLSLEDGRMKRRSRQLPRWARAALPPELLQERS